MNSSPRNVIAALLGIRRLYAQICGALILRFCAAMLAGARHIPGRSRYEWEDGARIHLDGPVAIEAAAARDVPRSGAGQNFAAYGWMPSVRASLIKPR